MNDQHPHAGYVGDDAHTTGSFATDPLFGALPGGYDAGHSGQYDTTQWNGSQQWDAGTYDTYVAQQPIPQQYDATGQWDATAWSEAQQTGQYETAHFSSYDTTGQWTTPSFETGTYDATAWNYAAAPEDEPQLAEPVVPQQYTPEYEFVAEQGVEHTAQFEAVATDEQAYDYGYDYETPAEAEEPAVEILAESPATATPAARPVRRSSGGSRGRRRTPAKRSALLTVAVPSACVMGVAGIAAASVGGLAEAGAEAKDDTTALAAADPSSVKPVAANNELDTQLAALSAEARDFGDRASRTQERIDLKLRQEAERKKREEEAARKEALRPKFALPVKLHQLSARYGQAGVNWMSVHTGIDFPVQYGSKVMAATDGTVRTQWNSAYGNMAIVTAEDGTETWYCHLSSTKIRSGKVKAGDVIAYSGNSGNSTGPHLHFEVRPNGGAAIDPESWLRSHGISPTG
ncbi:peptidoglycan DD-metalloendopeptidase family protein [Streptomyces sp. NPDC006551]|uniref:peptidoglycan DD-metalloendopeptidase family protein n=1 Tax=Streptomyces sp. NPDC006551 TaxID=3157178 RepID=UPI0033B3F908